MRLFVCTLALLCSLTAIAEERDSSKELLPPREQRARLDLLPWSRVKHDRFLLEHAELLRQLRALRGEEERLRQRATEAKDETAGAIILAAWDDLQVRVQPVVDAVKAALAEDGITQEQIDRARQVRSGEGADRRFAHALVLEVIPPLDEAGRSLMSQLIAAVDGAQQALRQESSGIRKRSLATEDEALRALSQGMARRLDQRQRVIETRFWRVVDAVLDLEQKQFLKRSLPMRARVTVDEERHLQQLPEMTASQQARITAVFRTVEAELAADRAAVERLRREFRERVREAPAGARTELDEARLRIARAEAEASERARRVLTPSQFTHYEAIPPYVRARERGYQPKTFLEDLPLSPDQEAQVAALTARFEGVRAEFDRALAQSRGMARELGSDSPQMAMVQMMRSQAVGNAQQEVLLLARETFLEVLSADQVVDWVLSPDARR